MKENINFASMTRQQTTNWRPRLTEGLIHVIGWGIIFAFPFMVMNRSGANLSWDAYLRHGSVVPISFLFVFYANYFFFIPKFLFTQHTKQFLLWNILLICALALTMHLWQEAGFAYMEKQSHRRPHRPMGPPRWLFLLRDMFSMVLTVGLSVAICMSRRWTQIENARREAEKSRTEAELRNLRSQLNPHFLLNTLNNIYALITFDTDKAQTAVQELSRLLRHVLYDNQQNSVTIDKEIDFIRNYIELMRIRLPANVEVTTDFDIAPESRTMIAPLIFISLIENAFKHGISPTKPSYIHIGFAEKGRKVKCEIANSYHPKNDKDKSGSGIGLELVRKRLELTYPDRYTWQQGVNGEKTEYRSILIIDTDPNK